MANNNGIYILKRLLNETLDGYRMTSAQACAVVGNFERETGGSFDPSITAIDSNGLRSSGIMQWNGAWGDEMRKWVSARNNGNWVSLEKQVDYFIKAETTGMQSGRRRWVKWCKDHKDASPEDAAEYFHRKIEVADVDYLYKSKKYARNWAEWLKKNKPDNYDLSTLDSGSSTGVQADTSPDPCVNTAELLVETASEAVSDSSPQPKPNDKTYLTGDSWSVGCKKYLKAYMNVSLVSDWNQGKRIRDFSKTVERAAKAGAENIVVVGSLNSAVCGIDTFKNDVNVLIGECVKHNIRRCGVLRVPYTASNNWALQDTEVDKMNSFMSSKLVTRGSCEFKMLCYCDNNTFNEDNWKKQFYDLRGTCMSRYKTDQIHPTARGYQIVAGSVLTSWNNLFPDYQLKK